jgi:hypothetical protein
MNQKPIKLLQVIKKVKKINERVKEIKTFSKKLSNYHTNFFLSIIEIKREHQKIKCRFKKLAR